MRNGPGNSTMTGGAADAAQALQRATSALNSQRPVEAEQIARQLASRGRHPQALQILGYALLMQGRAADAIAPLEDAARGRHDPEIETRLAIALRQSGRDDEALVQLKRAVKRKPPFPPAFCELGILLASLQQYDEAAEVLSRALELAPTMPELWIQLGYVELRRDHRAAAKAAFAKVLTLRPDHPDVQFALATAHWVDGEYQAAAEYYRRCLTQRPRDTSSRLYYGRCLLELGQLAQGHDCLRTAVRDDPKCLGEAMTALVASSHGRFWLKASDAARFLRGEPG